MFQRGSSQVSAWQKRAFQRGSGECSSVAVVKFQRGSSQVSAWQKRAFQRGSAECSSVAVVKFQLGRREHSSVAVVNVPAWQ